MTQPVNSKQVKKSTATMPAASKSKTTPSVRVFGSMAEAQSQENYRRPVEMPTGVIALENITGFPSYKRGNNNQNSTPIIYKIGENAFFKFAATVGSQYPTVQHFVMLQALISHFAFHCVDDGLHIIHLNDVMNFLGRNTHKFDISPLRTACIRYAMCTATYRNCWKEVKSDGRLEYRAFWHSNYITESSFIAGSEDDPHVQEILENLFRDNKKRHWIKFHPDIASTIVSLAKYNRNRIFSRYLFEQQDLDDDCKAIYCYLWTFGTLDKSGKGKVVERTKQTLMCGLSYLDPDKFDDWFHSKLSVLKAIGILDFRKMDRDYWQFTLANINNISHLKDYIHKHEQTSYYQKKKQGLVGTAKDETLTSSAELVDVLKRSGYKAAEIADILQLSLAGVYKNLKKISESEPKTSPSVERRELITLFAKYKALLSDDMKGILETMLASDDFLQSNDNKKLFLKHLCNKIRNQDSVE